MEFDQRCQAQHVYPTRQPTLDQVADYVVQVTE